MKSTRRYHFTVVLLPLSVRRAEHVNDEVVALEHHAKVSDLLCLLVEVKSWVLLALAA